MAVKLINKKGSTFHDFPYSHPERKCFHCWIINVTPPGPNQCLHECIYCYAREAIYSNYSQDTLVYSNLPELVDKDLRRLALCPPISLSNVSDPCQDIPELRREVRRLVSLLMDYGVSFILTTKGDPSFLLELSQFVEYKLKFMAITIEGTPEVLELLSPKAPAFEARVNSVRKLSSLGINTVIRLDPFLVHLFKALYGGHWWQEVVRLIDVFASAGARHITASTGRLSKKIPPTIAGCESTSTWQRIWEVIYRHSPQAAKEFEQEYVYEKHWSGGGYRLRRDLRIGLHRKLKEVVEARGMTYATCQELAAEQSDSPGLPHCEGIALPFCLKQADGRFVPIPNCTANCHVSCRGSSHPPCGRSQLIDFKPLTFKKLSFDPSRLWSAPRTLSSCQAELW